MERFQQHGRTSLSSWGQMEGLVVDGPSLPARSFICSSASPFALGEEAELTAHKSSKLLPEMSTPGPRREVAGQLV